MGSAPFPGEPASVPSDMLCERCKENKATVHVTEIVHLPPGFQTGLAPQAPGQAQAAQAASAESAPEQDHGTSPASGTNIQEQHLCERCAEAANLPHVPVLKKSAVEIWKLLQSSAQRSKREVGVSCPECGMTLLEFRQRGRFGCPRDYEVFAPHLRDLLERIHGATRHAGRRPGHSNEATKQRQLRLQELQDQLRAAIRSEAYEDAARLRDEIKAMGQA